MGDNLIPLLFVIVMLANVFLDRRKRRRRRSCRRSSSRRRQSSKRRQGLRTLLLNLNAA